MRSVLPSLGFLAAAALVASCAGAPHREGRAPGGEAPYDHAGVIETYEGARTCIACHHDAAREVATSLHYQQVGPAPNVVGRPPGFATGMMVGY